MSTAPFLDRLPPEVTQNIAEHLKGDHDGLEAFRALRLTCKELYFKTFRVFGIDYFSNISVAFNAVSLRRLQELVGHENSFGLSLTSFPKNLLAQHTACSPARQCGNLSSLPRARLRAWR